MILTKVALFWSRRPTAKNQPYMILFNFLKPAIPLSKSNTLAAFLLQVQAVREAAKVEAFMFFQGAAHPATAQPCSAKDAGNCRGT